MKKFLMSMFVFLFLFTSVGGSVFLFSGCGSSQSQDAPSDSDDDQTVATASGYWTDSGNYASSFAGGTGTSSDPYQIATAEQLARLAYLSNNDTSLDNNYILTADIDLSAHYWVPIGLNYKFCGTFDGDYHVISGMDCYMTSAADEHYCSDKRGVVGLFGHVSGGTIKNFVLANVHIATDSFQCPDGTMIMFGAVAGEGVASSIIEQVGVVSVVIKSTINLTSARAGYIYIGGLVGYLYNSTLSRSFYNAPLIASNAYRIGGLVGWLYNADVSDSYFYGNISVSGDACGGLVGETNVGTCNIERCYAYFKNGSFSNVLRGVGGIVGHAQGPITIKSCFAAVSFAGSSASLYGAIVGRTSSFSEGAPLVVSSCWFSGTGGYSRGYGTIASNTTWQYNTNYTNFNLAVTSAGTAFYSSTQYLKRGDNYSEWSIAKTATSTDTTYVWTKYLDSSSYINQGLPVLNWSSRNVYVWRNAGGTNDQDATHAYLELTQVNTSTGGVTSATSDTSQRFVTKRVLLGLSIGLYANNSDTYEWKEWRRGSVSGTLLSSTSRNIYATVVRGTRATSAANFYAVFEKLEYGIQVYVETETGLNTGEYKMANSSTTAGGRVDVSFTNTSGNEISRKVYAMLIEGAKAKQPFQAVATAQNTDDYDYIFVGFTTSNSAPNKKTPEPNNTYTVESPTSNIVLYAWFRVAITNEVVNDPFDDRYYFENGEYPQDAANNLEYGSVFTGTKYNLSISYDKTNNIFTMNGTTDPYSDYYFLITEAVPLEVNKKVKVKIEYLAGTISNSNLLNAVAEVYSSQSFESGGVYGREYPVQGQIGTQDLSYEFTLNSTEASSGKYIGFRMRNSGSSTATYSNFKFRVTIEYDMDSFLEANALRDSNYLYTIPYLDENGVNRTEKGKGIDVYQYEGKKYGRVAKTQTEVKWFKVQPIKWRVSDSDWSETDNGTAFVDNTLHTFNGTSDFINLGRQYMFSDKITVNVWAYMDDWSEYPGMRLISCTENGGWNIESSGGQIQFECYDSGVGYKTAVLTKNWADLASGWHMFTLIFNGSKLAAYVDAGSTTGGSKVSDAFSSGKIGYNGTNSIFVGAEPSADPGVAEVCFFKGSIKGIKILHEAYTVSQVRTLFATTHPDKINLPDSVYNQNFTAVTDKVLGFGAISTSNAKEGWSFTDSEMYANVSSAAYNAGYASSKGFVFESSFKQPGSMKAENKAFSTTIYQSAYLVQNGTTFTINNPSGNSMTNFKLQTWNYDRSTYTQPFQVSTSGEYQISFNKTDTVHLIRLAFNGNQTDPNVDFDVAHLDNGNYTITVQVKIGELTNGRFTTGSFTILGVSERKIGVANMEQINHVFDNPTAQATDLVAWLSSGTYGGNNVEYWTSDLANQLDTGKTITSWGGEGQAWLQSAKGYRLSMIMREGINYGGTAMRYIRITSNGSNVNSTNYYVHAEVQTAGGAEIVVFDANNESNNQGTFASGSFWKDSYLSTNYYGTNDKTIVLDIGKTVSATAVNLARFYADSRHFYGTHLEGSVDGVNWFNIWNSYNTGSFGNDVTANTYTETEAGRTFVVPNFKENLLNMDTVMAGFNARTSASAAMTKNADGSYTWGGATGYVDGDGSKGNIVVPYALKYGLYRLSYDAVSPRSDTNGTTRLGAAGVEMSSDMWVCKGRKHYECTFVVDDQYAGLFIGLMYGDRTTFSNIKLEYIEGENGEAIMNNNLLTSTGVEMAEPLYYQNSGWDKNLNPDQGSAESWSYANMGVANASTGYHAHMRYVGGKHGYVTEMINKSPSEGRWIATSQGISAGKIQAGHTYTIRLDAKAVDGLPGLTGGLYYNNGSSTDFHSGEFRFVLSRDWKTYYYTFTTDPALDESVDCSLYIYGHTVAVGTSWVDNIFLYEAGGGN